MGPNGHKRKVLLNIRGYRVYCQNLQTERDKIKSQRETEGGRMRVYGPAYIDCCIEKSMGPGIVVEEKYH